MPDVRRVRQLQLDLTSAITVFIFTCFDPHDIKKQRLHWHAATQQLVMQDRHDQNRQRRRRDTIGILGSTSVLISATR